MGFAARISATLKNKNFLSIVVLSVLTILAYSNTLENEFVWDDEFLIEKNSYLTDFQYIGKILTSNSTAGFGGKDDFYRPTQNLYYLFIYQLFGKSKIAFHLGNLLLHLVNSFLLFSLVLKITHSRFASFATSLLWVLHPTHVEAITYISGTADPMSVMFLLLCLLIYPFTATPKHPTSYWFSLLLFTLALLSKESLVIGPLLLMMLIFLISDKKWTWRPYQPTLGFWLVSLSYLVLRKTVLNFNDTYNFYSTSNIYTENWIFRLYTYLATLPEYLKILFYPLNLHMERQFPIFVEFLQGPVLLGSFILIGSFILACIPVVRGKNYLYLICWLWFFTAFVPMNGVLLPVNSLILEHWLYLPSIGLFIATGFLLANIFKRSNPIALSIVGLIAFNLIFLTLIRNRDWRTPLIFYSNILQYSSGSARVHNNIAMAYSEEKKWDAAMSHYQKAIEISDTYPQTHFNLARLYIEKHDFNMAFFHIDRSLELDPQFIYAHQLRKELLDFLNQ